MPSGERRMPSGERRHHRGSAGTIGGAPTPSGERRKTLPSRPPSRHLSPSPWTCPRASSTRPPGTLTGQPHEAIPHIPPQSPALIIDALGNEMIRRPRQEMITPRITRWPFVRGGTLKARPVRKFMTGEAPPEPRIRYRRRLKEPPPGTSPPSPRPCGSCQEAPWIRHHGSDRYVLSSPAVLQRTRTCGASGSGSAPEAGGCLRFSGRRLRHVEDCGRPEGIIALGQRQRVSSRKE
jgi:hypothetical protein